MNTPREILNFVGLEEAQRALGVSFGSVERAQRQEKLPAAWLDTLERLAGRPLPREVFNFKRAHPSDGAREVAAG